MILSWADRRLGAVRDYDLPVSGAAAEPITERAPDLHAVRVADRAAAAADPTATVTAFIDPHTGRGWGSMPEGWELENDRQDHRLRARGIDARPLRIWSA